MQKDARCIAKDELLVPVSYRNMQCWLLHYFWSIKNSTGILNKLKAKCFQASAISTYDFMTTLPHDLIKNQLVDLIENP